MTAVRRLNLLRKNNGGIIEYFFARMNSLRKNSSLKTHAKDASGPDCDKRRLNNNTI